MNKAVVTMLLGTWVEKTQTIKWRGTDPTGKTLSGATRFIDKDHAEWSMLFSSKSGEVVMDLAGKVTRRKE